MQCLSPKKTEIHRTKRLDMGLNCYLTAKIFKL
jgi:hypothetical protein